MNKLHLIIKIGLVSGLLLLTAGVGLAGQGKVDVCHITGNYDFGSGPVPIGHVITVADPAYQPHIDHGDPVVWHLRELPNGKIVCTPGAESLDTDNDGDGYSENQGDCNDDDAAVFPGATELCNGIDDNCDGQIDEGLSWDNDGDGHYSEDSCYQPADDCNDNDGTVYPGAVEVCGDGIDQDCNGADLSCDDVDNDGDGYTENQGDCNDDNATVFPGAPEFCDGLDNDCDEEVDEELTLTVFYLDDDGDGYGAADTSVMDCACPPGYVLNDLDCDDTDATIHPGATETCGDGIDQDCDGEDLACTYLVQPFFKCTEVVYGQYFVHFSYENFTSETITVPLGPNNYLIPTTLVDTQPPTVFYPGFHDDVFSTSFEGTKDWVLCTNEFCLIASARTSETDFCTGSYGSLRGPPVMGSGLLLTQVCF